MKPPIKSGNSPLDLAQIRARLNSERGQHYWRSLEEVAGTPEFREMLHREFPAGASEWWDGLSRRNFLKMAAATLALSGLTACTKQPTRQIFPYVYQPHEIVPGEPLYYATSMPLGGFATGVLAKSREGHPIKVDGSPEHPASLGGSSVWLQASILDLYDPDRSRGVTQNGDVSSWALFLSDLNDLVREQEAKKGAGLRFLTETVTSPTLAWQLNELLKKFPAAKWHQYESIARDNVREGARMAFGELLETQYDFEKAAVILALDSDFMQIHPERLRYARKFADGRRLAAGRNEMNRLYVVESTPSVTGTMAEHRLPLESGDIEGLARWLAKQMGADLEPAELPESPDVRRWAEMLVKDLQQHYGASLVIAGEWQPPIVHALAHWLNQNLGNVGNTVRYTESGEAHPVNQLESLRELAAEMKAGTVDALFILGGNPAYTAPADLEFGSLLEKVRRSVHIGLGLDETSARCAWHIPQAHYLESWGDARSFDGTVSLQQPLIAPLYDGKSAYEVLGAFTQRQPVRGDYDIISEYWKAHSHWRDFETGWRKAIHDGFVAGTELPAKQAGVKPDFLKQPDSKGGFRKEAVTAEAMSFPAMTPAARRHFKKLGNVEVNFRPDPNLWDGRFANNGWLQECPKPVSKLGWDNAVLISPALAEKGNLSSGDVVEINFAGRVLRGPVWVTPGQAKNSVTLHLGYGRARAGRVGDGVGFNAYLLRSADAVWFGDGAQIVPTGETHKFATAQVHHNLESPERQIYRGGTLTEFLANPRFVKEDTESPEKDDTLYNTDEFNYDGNKWGMSIDLTTCIGCNACIVACEVENNIPVVGKEQVSRGRDMLWIRVDTYYKGNLDNPGFNHMPVPCMHCEHAPCELVCPVEATLHDSEGLNVQVYNRCVGTRFCSNNCPYKVRRFNFLQYTDYALPNYEPMYNPEVTVRWRGVMEKCTYCVQRISAARITAEKENRGIRDGEVRTACQQACPTEAIVFGNLNDPDAKVTRLKRHPLDYPMLGQLNTRPRTTYLAKIENTNPEAGEKPPV